MSQPAALASIGLIPGILVVMLSAAASGMGLFFLSQCASRTDGRHASFFAISKLTWPGMAIFFDLAIAIKCFGVGVSYLIIIGDLMPQVGVTRVHTHTHGRSDMCVTCIHRWLLHSRIMLKILY